MRSTKERVFRERYAANLKRELPRIPFVGANGIVITTEDASPEEGSAFSAQASTSAETVTGRVRSTEQLLAQGVSPGIGATTNPGTALPKAGAQPQAERQNKSFGQPRSTTNADDQNPFVSSVPLVVNSDAAVFHAFAAAGKLLADLHVNYESQPEYPLQEIWKPGSKLNYRVEKMRLGRDKLH